MKRKSVLHISLLSLFFIFLLILLIPQTFVMPVKGADRNSYNQKSFWYYPWGESITHKGVDVFAREGTDIVSSTFGLVIYKGKFKRGGNVVIVLGPKWRGHYYAHLNSLDAGLFSFVKPGSKIGTVGTSGNAKGKPPHLHYSIFTLVPYPWRIDDDRHGWLKMFFLNPIDYLNQVK